MTTYQVTHDSGRKTSSHDTEDAARTEVQRVYGEDCYIHDDWQSAGYEGDSEAERLLVWSSENESENDDGSRAVASIRRWE